LKEVLEHKKHPSAGIPVDHMIILLDTQLLPNCLVREHRSRNSGAKWRTTSVLNWVWMERKQFDGM